MKLAIICMASRGSPAGVRLLARHFNHPAIDIYLHVDAKSSIDPYAPLAFEFPNVHLVGNRATVFWASFSHVQCIFNSIAEATARQAYDRFVLISEDTAPLTNVDHMLAAFEQNVEYMDTGRVRGDKGPWQRYKNFYYFDSFATSPRLVQLEHRNITEKMLDDLERLKSLKQRGKFPISDLYFGSSWWALTASAIEKIVTINAENAWLRESFEFSANPDESYFQTILGAVVGGHAFAPFIHVDFSRIPKPFRYSTYDELIEVQKTKRLFTRKVDFESAGVEQFFLSLSSHSKEYQ